MAHVGAFYGLIECSLIITDSLLTTIAMEMGEQYLLHPSFDEDLDV